MFPTGVDRVYIPSRHEKALDRVKATGNPARLSCQRYLVHGVRHFVGYRVPLKDARLKSAKIRVKAADGIDVAAERRERAAVELIVQRFFRVRRALARRTRKLQYVINFDCLPKECGQSHQSMAR